ncbi:copper-binding protein [uncultured Alsobacter sp.]|uniref:copper-binding protein n=1 Tax=uncultured Alsobacter sp. TaxID=1748258 RepID=UPI0026007DE9|nr:copper-binding protein [uncultured Alsobacter sp.]
MIKTRMSRAILAAATAAGLLLSPALAQDAVKVQDLPTVKGTVEKVDESAEKITLNHGAIPNLGMGGMKMVFKAADKAMLKQVKKGDTVLFTADRVNGQLTVTSIAKTK